MARRSRFRRRDGASLHVAERIPETDARLQPLARRLGARGSLAIAALLGVVLVGVAIVLVSGPGAIGQKRSLGPFVDQTDGKFGYAMLRPAAWTPVDARDFMRGYRDAPTVEATRLVLTVRNLAAVHRPDPDPNEGLGDMDWWMFQRASNLQGWTGQEEQLWRSNHVEYALVQALPNASIYATRTSGTTMEGDPVQLVTLVAYVVDQGQPIIVGLQGTANHQSLTLEELQRGGAVDSFITMVKSLRAIPVDPANESPPLS